MEKSADRKVREYSKGMQQRIGLAQALVHEPEIVFLDEPTDGVDPVGRAAIRGIVQDLKSRGTTVFINSPVLYRGRSGNPRKWANSPSISFGVHDGGTDT